MEWANRGFLLWYDAVFFFVLDSFLKDSEHFIYFCDDYSADIFHGIVFNILKTNFLH